MKKLKIYQSNISVIKRVGLIVLGALLTSSVFAQNLHQIAMSKIDSVNTLIEELEKSGTSALKEKMTVRTAEIFLKFANWDEANFDANKAAFERHSEYKKNADEMATNLPDFERSEVIILLNDAMSTLKALKDGKITRKATPDVDWAKITNDGNQLTFEGRPVFVADYSWKPNTEELSRYHGDLDGVFLTPSDVENASGSIKSKKTTEINSKTDATLGFIFLNHKNPPQWAQDKYGPNFKMRTNTYTHYDIDNPGAREMQSMLLEGTVPSMAGKKYTELGYMLCNEPHFYTNADGAKTVWASGPVSDYSIEKFKTWLKVKHETITSLNAVWKTNFASFKDVSIQIPIDISLRGTPKWYDWVKFNNERVTEWYGFLKAEIRKHDPAAKVHLKIMPNLWTTNNRNHGIDVEDLTEMSEIIGNDASAINSRMWGATPWSEHYSWEWRELFMGYDFMKSVSPNKIIFNSETHFLSATAFMNLYLEPEYVRCAFWTGHTLGLNANQIWYWPRSADGSHNGTKAESIAGSNTQAPRVTHEVHSTIMDLNAHAEEITAMQRQKKPIRIFYSKTSAFQKNEHMDDVYELYEALNFEGVPIGFATKNIINKQDNKLWETILVHKTEFVTADELKALQTYLDNGGTVISDALSLKKDEYGRALTGTLQASKGTLIVANTLDEFRTQALSIVENAGLLPEVLVSETNTGGANGCTWKCIKNADGNNVLSIANLGKSVASINIELKDAKVGTACTDLLTGNPASASPKLKPYDIYFVEIKDAKSEFTGTSSVKRLNAEIGILYPNPSNGEFTINLVEQQKFVNVQVYNLNGQLLQYEQFSQVRKIDYQLTQQQAGTYLVKVSTEKGSQTFKYQKI